MGILLQYICLVFLNVDARILQGTDANGRTACIKAYAPTHSWLQNHHNVNSSCPRSARVIFPAPSQLLLSPPASYSPLCLSSSCPHPCHIPTPSQLLLSPPASYSQLRLSSSCPRPCHILRSVSAPPVPACVIFSALSQLLLSLPV